MVTERKIIADVVNRFLLKEYVKKTTERAGFGGIDIQRNPMGTLVTLVAERPGMVIGHRGRTIKELTNVMENTFNFDNPQIEVEEEKKPNLNANIMAHKLAVAIERGWHFRRAGHSTVRKIMGSGARGCQVILAGKITGERHRTEKFKQGHIKYCGETALQTMEIGYAVAKKKLGTIGIKVMIMKPHAVLPDEINILTQEEAKGIVPEAVVEELKIDTSIQEEVEVEPEVEPDDDAAEIVESLIKEAVTAKSTTQEAPGEVTAADATISGLTPEPPAGEVTEDAVKETDEAAPELKPELEVKEIKAKKPEEKEAKGKEKKGTKARKPGEKKAKIEEKKGIKARKPGEKEPKVKKPRVKKTKAKAETGASEPEGAEVTPIAEAGVESKDTKIKDAVKPAGEKAEKPKTRKRKTKKTTGVEPGIPGSGMKAGTDTEKEEAETEKEDAKTGKPKKKTAAKKAVTKKAATTKSTSKKAAPRKATTKTAATKKTKKTDGSKEGEGSSPGADTGKVKDEGETEKPAEENVPAKEKESAAGPKEGQDKKTDGKKTEEEGEKK